MKISVIIVSYNCKAFLDYCLQSVTKALTQIDSEIIVVDNCSSDATVQYLKSKKYDLRLIENKKNIGFSKANNKAAKLAKGEYLFFLNPDTIIPEDLIDSFFKKKKNNMGIFSFRMIDGKGIFLRESKRNFPSICAISKKLIGMKSGYYSDLGEFDSGNVDVLCGANMLIENSLFNDINGFNEEYFMFGEDIEICYETFNKGFNNFYCGSSSIIHFKGESTVNDINYLRNFYGAMVIYYKNIFSKNLFLIAIIKVISRFIIILRRISPKKTHFKSKPKKNILYSNNSDIKLEKIFGDIILIKKIDEKLNDCNLIFDSNYLTNKEIISCVDNLKSRNKMNFWFLSSDYSYIIRAGGMNQKGNAIFL